MYPLIFYSLVITILSHELAHLVVAKLVGCKVEVFSLGFGPTLFKVNFKGTRYQLALIPLGGFCKLKDELTISTDPTAFSNLSYRKKISISLAGVTLNMLVGSICLQLGLQHHLADLYLFGYINLCLGVTNLLPFPALDGSYPILFMMERFFDRHLAYTYISRIVKVGFWILIGINIIFLPYIIKLILN